MGAPSKDEPLLPGYRTTRGQYVEWLIETSRREQTPRDHLFAFEPRVDLFEGISAMAAEVERLRAERGEVLALLDKIHDAHEADNVPWSRRLETIAGEAYALVAKLRGAL
jgi:hypothetical protein